MASLIQVVDVFSTLVGLKNYWLIYFLVPSNHRNEIDKSQPNHQGWAGGKKKSLDEVNSFVKLSR